MKYHNYFASKTLLKLKGFTERALVKQTSLSRSTIRGITTNSGNPTVQSLINLAAEFDREIEILAVPRNSSTEFSTVATCYKVNRDGFNSSKIHFMDLVDTYRQTLDPHQLLLAPPKGFNKQLTALLASIVSELCGVSGIDSPRWATKRFYLDIPWFISEVESLKASAILESPITFRKNNIFVQENFLARA